MSLLAQAVAALAVLAAVGAGLIAGVLFAFSNSVMHALARLPPAHGMAAMQHINAIILNPLFLGLFTGTALLCAALALLCLLGVAGEAALWLLLGAGAYLLGTFGVTLAFNVPLNNRLAASRAEAPGSAALWGSYVRTWLRWNHLRTAMATIAAVAFILAAR